MSRTLLKPLKAVTPPVLWRTTRKLIRSTIAKPPELFKGDDALFREALKSARTYGEYGCGASTIWVLQNTSADVLAVDSSEYWVAEVDRHLDAESRQRAAIHLVELGASRELGRPTSYEHSDRFPDYTNWIWEQTRKPDVVLIDGRFRVCCFLTSLKFAEEGTKLIFDDYINRPFYHIVENYLERAEVSGRQCMFVVPHPDGIDYERLETEIRNFRYVMD